MKRILLRSHKGPFDVASPEATWKRNLIGTNSGNLIFSHAAHKLLSTPQTEIVPSPLRNSADDAARINAEYDAVVVPLANAFRVEFQETLLSLTRLIERLRIPVVVLGVGAQATLDGDTTEIEPITEDCGGSRVRSSTAPRPSACAASSRRSI